MAINQPLKAQCGVGTACRGCGRRLPLHLAEHDDEAALWECVHCHTPFVGVLSPEVLRMLSRRVRLGSLHFDVDQAVPLTDAVLHVAWRAACRDQRHMRCDIRRSQRLSGQREVVALCLDERYRLSGPPLNGVVANLSRHGQLLITTRQLHSPAVLTQFQTAQKTVQLLGRVVWSRYLDLGCYGAGVDFIARFGRSASESCAV
jgi:hypothetical protein